MAYAFDAAEVQEEELIPIGNYKFMIAKGEERQTKNGHDMLCFEFVICDGEFQGRKVYEYFLVGHPNCARFAKISMSHLSKACALPKWQNVSELQGKFFQANVIHKPDGQGVLKEKLLNFVPYDESGAVDIFSTKHLCTVGSVNTGKTDLTDIPF